MAFWLDSVALEDNAGWLYDGDPNANSHFTDSSSYDAYIDHSAWGTNPDPVYLDELHAAVDPYGSFSTDDDWG